MWLTGYGGRAFETVIWPLLGFIFLPYTSCAYALAMNEFGGISGGGLALLILGVILDIGSHGGGGAGGVRYQEARVRSRRYVD
jgi:hypothetical protein